MVKPKWRVFTRLVVWVLAIGMVISQLAIGTQPTQAGSIASMSATLADSTKGASTSLTLTFTPATAINSYAGVSVSFMTPPDAKFSVGSVTLGTGSSSVFTADGAGINFLDPQWGSIGLGATSLPAEELTLVLDSITIPNKSGSFPVEVRTMSGFSDVDKGTTSVTVGTVALQGTVKNPDGQGVGDVYVEAQQKDDFGARFGSSTGSDGTYGIGDLTTGKTYIVQTFMNPDPNADSKGLAPADPVEITYTGTTITQDFTLSSPTKTVSGQVLHKDGTAVANGSIMAMRTDGPGFMNTTTDSSGNYSISVTGGRWEIRPDTFAGPGMEAPDYAFSGPGTVVKFAKDDTTESKTGVDFTVISANSTIKGSVTPNPGGFAGIGIHNKGGFGSGTGLDPNDASFSVKVPAGTYEIDMFADPTQAGDKYTMPAMDPITVGEGETVNLGVIKLVKMDKTITATVKDNATGTGLPNFEVGCFQPGGGGFAAGRTDSSGVATLSVVPGKWGCMAMTGFGGPGGEEDGGGGPGGGGPGDGGPGGPVGLNKIFNLTQKVYAQSSSEGAKYVVMGGPQFVSVTSDNAPSITFNALEANRTISVIVTDSAGNALQEHGFIEAELVGSDVGEGFDKGGGLGQPIDPNQPGMADLKVPAGIYDLRMMTPPGSDYSAGDATRVDVTNGNASTTIVLLENDSTISGTLKDEDGNTVTGVFAFVTASNAKGAFIPGDVDTSAGTYQMRVPSAGGELNLGYFVEPGSGYFPQPFSNNSVTPVAGETHTKDITMVKATSTVSVTVKDPDGNAVANAFVEADNRKADRDVKIDHFFHNGDQTDATGKVTLTLPAGSYTFKAFLPPETLRSNKWMPPKSEVITLVKGDSKDTTLQFQKADIELKGKVTKSDGTAVANAFIAAYSTDGESIEATTDSNGEYSINVTAGTWKVEAEKDDTSSGSTQPDPLLSLGNNVNATGTGSITTDLVVSKGDALSSPVTQTYDTDNAKLAKMTDGVLDGAQVSIPQDALDSDGSGGNATVTLQSTVELPRQLLDKPIGNVGLDITATDASGQAITSTNSTVAITLPIKRGDLDSAGIGVADIGKKASMSYYDEENGKWTPLEGAVSYVEQDSNGDGDYTDAEDKVLVTGQSSHFTAFALTASTDSTPPSAPTSVTATDAKSGGQINLSWTNPTDSDFAKIRIYRSTTEGTVGSAITTIDSTTTTSYEDKSLTDGTKYYYVVRAIDSNSNESTNTDQVSATPSSTSTSTTTTTLPKTGAQGANPLLPGLIVLAFASLLAVGYRKLRVRSQS